MSESPTSNTSISVIFGALSGFIVGCIMTAAGGISMGKHIAIGFPADPCILTEGKLYEVDSLSRDFAEGVWLRYSTEDFARSQRLFWADSEISVNSDYLEGATHVQMERYSEGVCRFVPFKQLSE